VMTEDDKRNTAYHEAGHAIVALSVPGSDPLHKATIIPRGRSLGLVMQLPEADRLSHTRQWCVSRLAITLAGREAEIMLSGLDKVTNGATSDIQQATNLSRAMVMEWGMSDKLGRVRYQSNEQEVFLGHSVARSTNISDDTARLIDSEIRSLIEGGEQEARRILTERRADWEAIAQGLLEYETLTGDEINDLLKGKKPNRESVSEPSTPRASAVPPAGRPRPRPDPDPGLEPQPQA
jgi:cell division protease FtsH